MMDKEASISFLNNKQQRLYGILHIPEDENILERRIGVNLLNPGLKNRVAPNRLNVKIARKLCAMGFYVLRFDPSGIGDSEGELSTLNEPVVDLWGMIQRGIFVADTIAANSYFISEARLDRLVLLGQCGAGVTAGLVGARDHRVKSLVLIDTPFRIVSSELEVFDALLESYTGKQLIKEQIGDLFKFNWAANLFSKDFGLSQIKRKTNILRYIYRSIRQDKSKTPVSERFNHKLAESLIEFMDKGSHIYYLFAENDFSLREFNNDFRYNFLENNSKRSKRYSVDIIKDANHIYTETEWQKTLISHITTWLIANETNNKNYGNENEFDITVTTYEKSKHDIINILNRNRVTKHDKPYFYWKYIERVKSHGEPTVLFCTLGKDKVVGSLTCYATSFAWISEENQVINHIGDISVDEEYRRKGIALRMIRGLIEKSGESDFYLCIPTHPARTMLIKAGWKRIVRLRCYTLILGFSTHSDRWLDAVLVNIMNFILKLLGLRPREYAESNYRFEEIKEFDSRFDQLWHIVSRKAMLMFSRNKHCLEWRYLKNPAGKYRIFQLCRYSSLKGYVVLADNNNGLCSIVDILSENHAAYQVLILSVIKFSIQSGYDKLEILLNEKNKEKVNFLRKNKFIKRKGVWDIMGYCNEDNIHHELFMNPENWFMTSADKEI